MHDKIANSIIKKEKRTLHISSGVRKANFNEIVKLAPSEPFESKIVFFKTLLVKIHQTHFIKNRVTALT